MKSLDENLTLLAAITGKNPLSFDVYHSHTSVSVDCNGVNCFGGCPFYDLNFYNTEKYTSCSAPKGNSPELFETPIRTYKDATTLYPELFL
jgi:hypothetical protein